LEVWAGGRQLELGGPHQRALLALLLVRANRVVSVERLAHLLWSGQPPPTGRGLVQGCVAQLRRALREGAGPGREPLLTRRPGYLLEVRPGELDLDRFEQLVAAGEYAEALAVWRGPALDGITVDACRADGAVLDERRMAVLEQRIDVDLWSEQATGTVGELRALVRAHPLRERLWAQLMLALYVSDRQAEALATYQELRRTLVEQLGIEPATTVQNLHAAILAGGDARQAYLAERPAPGAAPTPTPASGAAPDPAKAAPPAQLPGAMATFTGRTDDLKYLEALLGDGGPLGGKARIGVVTGTAGVGKSALAVQWAHLVRDRFPDGQLYVNLRGYATAPPLRPIEALAGFLHAFGVPVGQVPAEPDQAAALYRTLLAGRRVLVVLDNARTAEQIRPLLPGGDDCVVLVTSRHALGGLVARDGAVHLALDVLAPDEAQVLLARVLGERRVDAEPEAVVELARLCAYLPLALRIAAANLTLRPDRRIADHVAELAAGNRLGALTVDGDESSAVRASFDLSYATLPADARRLFRLLGLVPGPHVTVGAAAALAGLAPDRVARLLYRLAAAHLLDQPAPDRYGSHDLLRLYAAERGGEEDSTAERAAATGRLVGWYLSSVDAAARLLYPEKPRLPVPAEMAPTELARPPEFADHAAAGRWLDGELPNLLAAARSAASTSTVDGARAWLIIDALRGYFWLRVHTAQWLAATGIGLAAAEAAGDLPGQAAMHLSRADVHRRRCAYRSAIQHYTLAQDFAERAGWVEGRGAALGNLGSAYFWVGRLPEAAAHYERALALARQQGRRDGQAVRLSNLGLVYFLMGQLDAAESHHARSLALNRQRGSRANEGIDLANLGETYLAMGRFELARYHLDRAVPVHHEVGDRAAETETLSILVRLHLDTGRVAEAAASAREAVALAGVAEDPVAEASALNAMAAVHLRLDERGPAIERYRQALRLARETRTRYAELIALVGLAEAYRSTGAVDQARACAHRALRLARHGGYRMLAGQAHVALAAIHLDRENTERACRHADDAVAVFQTAGNRPGEARARQILDEARCHANA
jgi:DNA-binding SARP family transcriptional activator